MNNFAKILFFCSTFCPFVNPCGFSHNPDPLISPDFSVIAKGLAPRGQRSKPELFAPTSPLKLRLEIKQDDIKRHLSYFKKYLENKTAISTGDSPGGEDGASGGIEDRAQVFNFDNNHMSLLESLDDHQINEMIASEDNNLKHLLNVWVNIEDTFDFNPINDGWGPVSKGLTHSPLYPYHTAFGTQLYTQDENNAVLFSHPQVLETLPISIYNPPNYVTKQSRKKTFRFRARLVRVSSSLVYLYPWKKDTAGTLLSRHKLIPLYLPFTYLTGLLTPDKLNKYSQLIENTQGLLQGLDALGFANRSVRPVSLTLDTAVGTPLECPSMIIQSYMDYHQSMNWGPFGRNVNQRKAIGKHGFRPIYAGNNDENIFSVFLKQLYDENIDRYHIPLLPLLEADILELLSLRVITPTQFPGNFINFSEKNRAESINGFVFYYPGRARGDESNNRYLLVPSGNRFYSKTILKPKQVEAFEKNILINLKKLIEAYRNPTFNPYYANAQKEALRSLRIVFRRLDYMSRWKLTPLLKSPTYSSIFKSNAQDASFRIAVFQAFQDALEVLKGECPEIFERDPYE